MGRKRIRTKKELKTKGKSKIERTESAINEGEKGSRRKKKDSTDFDERFERLKEKKTKRSLKITNFTRHLQKSNTICVYSNWLLRPDSHNI